MSYTNAADDEHSELESSEHNNDDDVPRFQILPQTNHSRPDELGDKEIAAQLPNWGDAGNSRQK